MDLAHLPGRSYHKFIAEISSQVDKLTHSFRTGKKAIDAANDLTILLDARLVALLPGIYIPMKDDYSRAVDPGPVIRERFTSILMGIEYAFIVCSEYNSGTESHN